MPGFNFLGEIECDRNLPSTFLPEVGTQPFLFEGKLMVHTESEGAGGCKLYVQTNHFIHEPIPVTLRNNRALLFLWLSEAPSSCLLEFLDPFQSTHQLELVQCDLRIMSLRRIVLICVDNMKIRAEGQEGQEP